MPRINHYIRVEDWPKYKRIKDVPKWLHDSIQKAETDDPEQTKGKGNE